MATNKVSLTKLGLKKNTNTIQIEWNGQIVNIKEYLSIQDKLNLIERIINQSLDTNNFVNPARLDIFMTLETLYAYTDINFTDKQKADIINLYDLFISSGLWEKIKSTINNEFIIIENTSKLIIDEIYKYKNSALGILQAAATDYNQTNFDANVIRDKLTNKENVEFVKEVIDKLG